MIRTPEANLAKAAAAKAVQNMAAAQNAADEPAEAKRSDSDLARRVDRYGSVAFDQGDSMRRDVELADFIGRTGADEDTSKFYLDCEHLLVFWSSLPLFCARAPTQQGGLRRRCRGRPRARHQPLQPVERKVIRSCCRLAARAGPTVSPTAEREARRFPRHLPPGEGPQAAAFAPACSGMPRRS